MLRVQFIFEQVMFSSCRRQLSSKELPDTIGPYGQKSVHCGRWFQLKRVNKFWPACLFNTYSFGSFPQVLFMKTAVISLPRSDTELCAEIVQKLLYHTSRSLLSCAINCS